MGRRPADVSLEGPRVRCGRAAAAALALLCAGPALGEATQGVSDDEILLGMTASFTGTTKELGRQWKIGWDVAFATANEEGGVHGRRITLLAVNDDFEPERAKVAARELVEGKKIFAMVGSVGTEVTQAYLLYLFERQILLFCPLSGGDHLHNDPPDRYVFTCRPSYADEVAAAVRHLVEIRHIRPGQIAVFTQADGAGAAGLRGFALQMRRYKRDPRANVHVTYERNTAAVDAAVRRLRPYGEQLRAVVTSGKYLPVASFIEKTRDLNLLYTSTSGVEAETLADELKKLGPKYLENIIVTQPGPPATSRATAVLKYQQALKKHAPDARPDLVSLQGYLSALVFVEGLKRAGRALDTEKLVDALESIRNLEIGIGVPVAFGPSDHQAWHKVWALELQPDLSWKPLELE